MPGPDTNQNFTVIQGDDATIQVPIKESDGITPATSADLAGASIAWSWGPLTRIGNTLLPGLKLGTKTLADTLTLTSYTDAAGVTYPQTVQIPFTSSDTASLTGSFYHELKVTKSSQVQTITTGTITVKPRLK